MRFLVFVCVFFASALAKEYLYGTAELQAARDAFFEEYKRLAKLAELAPDIFLIYDDPKDSDASHTYSFSTNLGKEHRFKPVPKVEVPQAPTAAPDASPALEVTEVGPQEEPVTAAVDV
ncbi:uncharacterized protein [Panulirus ornatus]|uniref:uncharacterized protein n=1 Tax=Panulirus ornatus TaxID=150431 RepID=UPI003A83B04F